MAPVIRTAFSPNICLSCFRKWYEEILLAYRNQSSKN
jgi:hypothetical protein